jgi:hypothetical protein
MSKTTKHIAKLLERQRDIAARMCRVHEDNATRQLPEEARAEWMALDDEWDKNSDTLAELGMRERRVSELTAAMAHDKRATRDE